MKKISKILLGLLGLGGIGLYIWSKVGQTKQLVNNLQVFPMIYGGVNDFQIDLSKGIKIPIAIDFMNRSDASCKLRLNSLTIINSSDKVIAYTSAGNYVVNLEAYQTDRLKNIDLWIGASTGFSLIGYSLITVGRVIATGDTSSLTTIKEKAKKLVEGCIIQLSLTINEAVTVSLEIPYGETGEVNETSGVNGLGLVCAEDRTIKPLSDYAHLIPGRENLRYEDKIVFYDVKPQDTAKFIRRIAREYKKDTSVLAKALKGESVKHTIENIWNFVAEHIKYVQDASDKEQVRRPLRTLYDQKGDCDCYATLIASICENLDYSYTIRIAEYDNKGYYQHVYCIIEGYVCDPVVDRCFYEKKPTKVKDF